jgi:hypothetical protein
MPDQWREVPPHYLEMLRIAFVALQGGTIAKGNDDAKIEVPSHMRTDWRYRASRVDPQHARDHAQRMGCPDELSSIRRPFRML